MNFKSTCMILLIIQFADSVTINNKVRVVRNDCYERMAIGERLNTTDVYKTLSVKTVQECQMACTEEQEICRTFSFGVGIKGNTTCELSSMVIKETPDLKPIGTNHHIEFDLYIKKLGCKIVAPINYLNNFNLTRNNSNSDPIESQFIGKPIRVQSHPIGVASGPETRPIPIITERYNRRRPYYDNRLYDHYRPYHPYDDDYGYGYYRPRPRPEPEVPYPHRRPNYGPYYYDRKYSLDGFEEWRYRPWKPYRTEFYRPYLRTERPDFREPEVGPGINRLEDKADVFPEQPRYDSNFYDGDYRGSWRGEGGEKSQRGKVRQGPITSTSIGKNGQSITSIITEIPMAACFRRVLAGKRIVEGFVRRSVRCERVEDCQRECSDEKRFLCEGFNYRLDATGHGQGDCELLDLPLERLEVTRDVLTDPDYDYYERDRNNDAPECKGIHRMEQYYDDKENYNVRRNDYDDYPIWNDRYDDYDYYYRSRPYRDEYVGGHRGGKEYKYQSRGQFFDDEKYDHNPKDHLPSKPRKPLVDEPYLPQGYWDEQRPNYDHGRYWDKYFYDREKDRSYWGFPMQQNGWGNYGGSYGNFGKPDSFYGNYDHRPYEKKDFYLPPDDQRTKNWGQYGGSYGTNKGAWGFNRHDRKYQPFDNSLDNTYLPPLKDDFPNHIGGDGHYPISPHHSQPQECSLRTCVGFKLSRRVIRKEIAVPHIYQCEILCYKEKGFPCVSFAFRYTAIPGSPENCYLSDRHFKELDYYVDLEPDRDFDIYTMHNLKKCNDLVYDSSECFWRVRSGQRLEQKIVRDSLNVESIVQCQIECLKSQKFTCRAFSYRYGPPASGGVIDNCQLTDWPYIEIDPRVHLTPEHGFELYDRGSYGHGCEPNHFSIGLKPGQTTSDKRDEVCYIVYGSPAKLLTQSTRKSIRKDTESECKAECTSLREKTIFQCNSLSYRTNTVKKSPNCHLSDIVQRDLLSNVDYTPDTDSWLFAWDNHNPHCALMYSGSTKPIAHFDGNWDQSVGPISPRPSRPWKGHVTWSGGEGSRWGGDEGIESSHERNEHNVIPWKNPFYPLETWRVYSVKGWPCKSLCKENQVAGFWYCYLEGAAPGSWDYCCRPDHQCGYSEGFSYQWCYVGPEKTQWRKCNDHYYPYHEDTIHDHQIQYSTHNYQPYSEVPSGFGPPRHWPVAYLHRDSPPNETTAEHYMDEHKIDKTKEERYKAIENLINVIKTNDAKDIEYKIANSSNKSDDVLLVKIPLALNVTNSDRNSKRDSDNEDNHNLESVDIVFPDANDDPTTPTVVNINTFLDSRNAPARNPTYTKSYIERTYRVPKEKNQ